ncbi:Large exoprotein involved in heme utilization or adhesion (plasmid) [Nostoc flagelliforme CCNUN1]|uniref:Large exoprotein involved in heme utilization or adhesion n=1 Tax=Nostoc flagelliforme CCNUN1 TaxID=2038116 RepID=A0A2K8T7K2_9NOSO|nr:filamentous hemagglutinin N-terminal domain-containing protein [Nostoc flagelliforme]AUB43678.1 Large exoprotein involved in heme utilization or adhesion [Nostoc flagelliforme CCNUN1]
MSGLGFTHWGALVTIAFGVSFCTIDYADYANAQITPDGTLPNNSSVTREGDTFNITGGTQAGSNLFHSFGEFSVNTGGIASFNNPLDIQNIISRVTGGSVSNIDGIISTLGTANLFLINPNGIVFGQNAQLNIGGSFVASTANALQFGNRGFFSATDKNIPSPLLTIDPSALLFNQINQNATIQNNSVAFAGTDLAGFNAFGLRVPNGKSLLLVGGNVSMNGGQLNAYSGRVELGGLGEPGTVALGVDGDNLRLRFPENVTRSEVSLTNQAAIYVEGAGGDDIAVNAKNLEILGGTVLSAGIGQGLGTPETIGGDITLNATGEIKVAGGSIVLNLVRLGSQGNGGNITIDSGSFSLQNSAQLAASTLGQGNAGNVTVWARDAVFLTDNTAIFSTVEAGGVGKGGNIDINAATLSLTDSARFEASTSGLGNAGNVTVWARDAVSLADNAYIFSTVQPGGVGKGGNIDINAARLSLIDGGILLTITREASDTQPAGRGNAGNVNVKVTGTVDITGEKDGFASGISSRAETGTVSNAGNITIDSGDFSLQDGAQLSASTLGQGDAGNVTVRAQNAVSIADANILSTVEAGGVSKGGNIDINAATLSLKDGAQLLTITRSASDSQPAGRGDAGNVNINVTGSVDIAGEKNGLKSGIFSSVSTGTVSNGGNITVDSGDFSLRDSAQLSASTSGLGNAGNVKVRAQDAVSIADANILSTVEAGGVSKGGNIDINAATLSLKDGAQLLTITRGASATQPAGRGDAGNVNINVTGSVDIAGEKNGLSSAIASSVETGAVGNGGNITIDSGSFSLRERTGLQASTSGLGNAGNVTVRARDAVSLADAKILSTVEAGGVGEGGNIDINAATLSLKDGAQLQTLTRGASATQPAGRGDAGNVNINVTGVVDITSEKNGFPSGILSNLDTGTVGNGGNIIIDSGSFSLRERTGLQASTSGLGNAGNVIVRARDAVSLAGQLTAILSTVEPGGVGKGGNININAATLSLVNGAQLLTATRNASNTQPAGRGDAGNVNINVTDAVDISGEKNDFASGIFSLVQTGTVGNGGNIAIDSGSFSLRDGAQLSAETLGQGNAGTIKVNAAAQVNISGKSSNFNSGLFVNSQSPTGTAGDIIVTSPRITLDNSGRLNAESASGNGGDINLQTDLLLLRRGAQISTTAGTAEAGGDGGNINIDVPSGFIVAVPNENSDIAANAFTGAGGRVNIKANGIYGIEFRESSTPLSDITASSEFGTQGTVELNTPGIDPNSGLVALPTVAVDTQIAQGCYSPGYAQNSFIITGRGGLPPNPREAFSSNIVRPEWATLGPSNDINSQQTIKENPPIPTPPAPIVEATGWGTNTKGEIVLTANASTGTPHKNWQQSPVTCSSAKSADN